MCSRCINRSLSMIQGVPTIRPPETTVRLFLVLKGIESGFMGESREEPTLYATLFQ